MSESIRRVLIVDDSADSRDALAMVLLSDGYQVETVGEGLRVVEAVRAFRPGVVILDIGLPDIDGYEVARRLRDEFGGELLLVALTGYSEQEDMDRAEEIGFDHYLVKPVNLADLQEAMPL